MILCESKHYFRVFVCLLLYTKDQPYIDEKFFNEPNIQEGHALDCVCSLDAHGLQERLFKENDDGYVNQTLKESYRQFRCGKYT